MGLASDEDEDNHSAMIIKSSPHPPPISSYLHQRHYRTVDNR